MLQLTPQREPEWFEAIPASAPVKGQPKPSAVRIRFRFSPTEALNAARRYVRTVIAAEPTAESDFAFVAGALIWGALEWEGVGDADGAVAPLTAENLIALIRQRPDAFDRCAGFYVDPLMRLLSEKNGSGSSPKGTSAGAAPIAGMSAKAAPAKAVRSSRTRRKPKRASGSGKS